jgi:hypothetical protein
MHARCGFFVFVRQCEEVAEAFPMPFSFLGFQKREEASAILKWPKSFGRNWLLDVVKNGWRYTLRRYLYTVSRILCRAHLAFQTCNGWCNAIRRQTEGQLCSYLQADLIFGNRQRWSYPSDIIFCFRWNCKEHFIRRPFRERKHDLTEGGFRNLDLVS